MEDGKGLRSPPGLPFVLEGSTLEVGDQKVICPGLVPPAKPLLFLSHFGFQEPPFPPWRTAALCLSPAGPAQSFPPPEVRVLASGTPAQGGGVVGVTCRPSRGSPSAARSAEPGRPWSTLDTWSWPQWSRPACFFTEGKFWKKSKVGGGWLQKINHIWPGAPTTLEAGRLPALTVRLRGLMIRGLDSERPHSTNPT